VGLLKAKDVAELLSVKPSRVYELARRGLLPCVRLGRNVRFDPEQIRQWVENGGQGLEQADE